MIFEPVLAERAATQTETMPEKMLFSEGFHGIQNRNHPLVCLFLVIFLYHHIQPNRYASSFKKT